MHEVIASWFTTRNLFIDQQSEPIFKETNFRTKDRIESGLSCPSWDQEDEVCEILAISRSLTAKLRQRSDTSFPLISATTYFEVL